MALFGCLWLPDFPAWAALRADPDLHNRPLCVLRSGRVLALSPRACEYGIARGWTVQRTLSLVPQIIALPHDAAACAFAWEQVLNELYEYTPRIEVLREGLALFEVPTREEARQKLAQRVRDWNGHCGAASTRVVAELAAYTALPGIMQNVRAGRETSFLAHVAVETLGEAGISAHTIERLRWFGWQYVGQLSALSRRQLCAQFEDGGKLWRFAQAATSTVEKQAILPYVPPSAIEARLVFDDAATHPAEWEAALKELLQRACGELSGRGASSLSVAVETPIGRRAASRLLREPVSSPRALQTPAHVLLRDLLGKEEAQALEVRLGNLSVSPKQGELFATSSRREAALHEVLHRLEARHAGAVKKLQTRDPHSPLPEEQFALVPWLDAISRLETASRKASALKRAAR